jgi:antagonist of KipI
MISVLKSGMQTTIQDPGRYGFQAYGVSAGGSMSTFSSRLSNLLVGNEMDVPVLEIVQSHNAFLFEEESIVSFCGGGLAPEVSGKELPVFEPLLIEGGTIVQFRKPAPGFRLYMAIAGGFQAGLFLKSYSTDLLSCSGGYEGRILKKDDRLSLMTKPSQLSENIKVLLKKNVYFHIDKSLSPKIFSKEIRIINGPEYALLSEVSRQKLISNTFTIGNEYNRMGYRLRSEPLVLSEKKEMISTAVCKGIIQLFPDGQTVALMADCQTLGGYPRIAKIIEADHCICAQLKPRDEISFSLVSLEEAEELYLEQEQRLFQIQGSVKKIFSNAGH